jgi:cell division protein FtsQ
MSIGRVRKHYPSAGFSWKIILKATALTLFVLVACIIFTTFKSSEYFPIHNVKVYGVQYLDHQDVQTLISPFVNDGFFRVDLDRIKERVLQLPWVAKVVVRRVWPDQVVVNIIERIPVALWNNTTLLSSAGEIFTPPIATYPTGLPQLIGPAGEQIEMVQYYAMLSKVLMPLHFKIARLELTPSMTWSLTLDNGIKLSIGHKDILTRLDHFVKVYPKIVGNRVDEVEYIDLRYPNGMAVRWKSVT